ncbi:MAG: WD40 repeat domain-containing protein [Gemmatimonadota bacterium]
MKQIALAALALVAVATSVTAQQYHVLTKVNIGGDGGTDYLNADAATGRVFISRGTHVMVVNGKTGAVVGDIADTPRVHGIAFAPKANHGFTTNGGDSTVTMFDLKTLAPIKKIATHTGGLDGIMYDDASDQIILTNHSRPVGTATAINPTTGDIVGVANLEDTAPEGAASDGKGKLFVNNEGKNTIQVIEAKSMKVLASWSIAPCDGPTGIAYDRKTDRIFSGCSKTSVVVDAKSGKVVAQITNGDGVDALGWDPAEKLIYIPGGDGTLTIVHQDSPDKYSVVATVATMRGAKTVTVDLASHIAYVFTPEYGPAPAGTPTPANGRAPRGPMIGAWLIAVGK